MHVALPPSHGGWALASKHSQVWVSWHVVHAAGRGKHLFSTLPLRQYTLAPSQLWTMPHEKTELSTGVHPPELLPLVEVVAVPALPLVEVVAVPALPLVEVEVAAVPALPLVEVVAVPALPLVEVVAVPALLEVVPAPLAPPSAWVPVEVDVSPPAPWVPLALEHAPTTATGSPRLKAMNRGLRKRARQWVTTTSLKKKNSTEESVRPKGGQEEATKRPRERTGRPGRWGGSSGCSGVEPGDEPWSQWQPLTSNQSWAPPK